MTTFDELLEIAELRRHRPERSRRARISRLYRRLLLFILLFLCMAGGLGVIALRSLESRFVADVGESLAFTADEVAGQLNTLLWERSSDVRLMAHALKTIRQNPVQLRRYLESVREEFRACCWIGVTNDAGTIIGSTSLSDIGVNRNKAEWFQAVRDMPHSYVHEIEGTKNNGAIAPHGVAFTAPIWSSDGTFLGAVSLHLGFPEIEGAFARTIRTLERQRGFTGKIDWLVLTSTGDILDESLSLPVGRLNLKRAGLPSAVAITSEWAGYVEEMHIRRQVPVVTGYANVRRFDGSLVPDWRVLVRIDRRDVIAPIRALLWKLAAGLSLLFLPVIGLLWWTTHRLRRGWDMAIANEERLEATLSSVGEGVIVLNQAARIMALSDVAERLSGWTVSESKGRLLKDVFPLIDETDRQPIGHFESLRDKVRPCLLIARDGSERPVEASVVPVGTSQDRTQETVLILRDLRERRESDLQNARLAAIVESSDDAIIGKNLDGAIVTWNKGAERLYGYTEAEMKGQAITRLFPAWLSEEFVHIQNRLRRGERIDHYATTRVRKDGTPIPVSISISPIKNQEGRIVGASSIARDLSDRTRPQEELPASMGA